MGDIMNEKTAEEYAKELIEMYKTVKPPVEEKTIPQASGGLTVNATTLRKLYPVPSATVTVFKGDYDNMEIIDRGYTDDSGQTGIFYLEAPDRALSESAGAQQPPYASYNISVKADGFIEQINLNVPIFSGVISVQSADLIPISAAGKNRAPRVFDEGQKYNL